MRILSIILAFVTGSILLLSVRGLLGNPTSDELVSPKWKDHGPFEQRARYALTYSLVEDRSAALSVELARFSLPDLGYKDGKYVSLFAPAVSFLAIPGYLLGKIFGISQVGSFLTVSAFAVMNVVLINLIAQKLGAGKIASFIASLIFIFATPAYSYATNLFQHHISTFLILFGIYLLFKAERFWNTFLIWILYGVSIAVDYPNVLMMLPIVIFSLLNLVTKGVADEKLKISIDLKRIAAIFSILIPLSLFFWFNKVSYGSPFQLAGTVKDVFDIKTDGSPVLVKSQNETFTQEFSERKTAIAFFDTRNILQGLNVHFFSPDRGIIYYAPVILFGILGIKFLNQKKDYLLLLVSIAALNVILYSMWGDPWGGWAFGSRYLIISYAIFSILIAFAIDNYMRREIFSLGFYVITIYSVVVNTLGALTTSLNPPKAQAQELSYRYGIEFLYTPKRNLEFLLDSGSKSFAYQIYFKNYMSAWKYFFVVSLLIIFVLTSPYIYLWLVKDIHKKIDLFEKFQNLYSYLRINLINKINILHRY